MDDTMVKFEADSNSKKNPPSKAPTTAKMAELKQRIEKLAAKTPS